MLNRINFSSIPQVPLSSPKALQNFVTTSSLPQSSGTPQRATNSGGQVLSAMSLAATNVSTVNQTAIDTLKKPPFAPSDVNLFTPQTYPSATTPKPAAARTISETQIKSQLTKTFSTRFNGNSSQISSGMAVYNDATLKKMVPDPQLRAAVAVLKGTPGEAAIDTIKGGAYSKVSFATLPSGIIAAVQPDSTGKTKPQLLINNRYQYEDFRQLAPSMAHESLHQDTTDSGREERISHSIETMIYGKLLLEDPTLATSGTELARRQNTKFMARLNSRDANGNLRLFTSQGNVYPGGTPLANFGAAFTSKGGDTPGGTVSDSSPGNQTLQKMLKAMTGVNVLNPKFDANTESVVDKNQIMFTPVQLVQLAKILKLKT